jgi:hypothetical protein
MQGFDHYTVKNSTAISALQLKQVLIQLSQQQGISFRCRLIGEMWMTNMMKVSHVTETSVMLYDEREAKYSIVAFNDIMQFEIDTRFQIFQPYYHYIVTPAPELA